MSRFHTFLFMLVAGVFAFLLLALFMPYQAQWGHRLSANFITGLFTGVNNPFISAWIVFGLVFTLVFAIVVSLLIFWIQESENLSIIAILAMFLNVGPSIWFGIHMHRVFQGTFAIGPIFAPAIAPAQINVAFFVNTIVLPGVWYLSLCMLALVMRPRTSTILFMATAIASIFPIAEVAVVWFEWMKGGRSANLLVDQAMVVWFWVEFVDMLILATAYMLATRAAVVEPSVASTV